MMEYQTLSVYKRVNFWYAIKEIETNVYAPFEDETLKLLVQILKFGDFNTRLRNGVNNKIVRNYGENIINDNGEMVIIQKS